jgi:toxin CptA
MPNFPTSSAGSAPCRLEWRPSRWLLAALLVLSLLAPLSVLGSGLPRALAWPAALAAAGYGLRLAWKQAASAPRQLVLAVGGGGSDLLDGRPLHACHVGWRGPLAFVHAIDRDGRSHRLAWWPDTLPAPLRRELRLAVAARPASRRARPVAP